MAADLPQRGSRPSSLAVPPRRAWRDRRPLKRWRYVGLWGEQAMLCAARVSIGPATQRFWGLWDGSRLRGSTRLVPFGVAVDGVVRAGPLRFRWHVVGEPLDVTSRHGDSYIWTRKQEIVAFGTIDGRPLRLRGLIDDSAGYHARDTEWRWLAGVGETPDGVPVAFNFCEGLHDAETASERAVWTGGVLSEPPRGSIARDLSGLDGPAGEWLAATVLAVRERRERLPFGLVESDYRQPFATFSGVLPGGTEVARGWGVLEDHRARW